MVVLSGALFRDDEISWSMRGMRACIEWFLVEKTGEWAKAVSSHQYIYNFL